MSGSNFLDWRFEKQLFPFVIRVLNGFLLIVIALAGVISIIGGIYMMANNGEKFGAGLLFGGPIAAALLILLVRLYSESITVMFEIRRASGDMLSALRSGPSFGAPSSITSSTTPPIPSLVVPPLPSSPLPPTLPPPPAPVPPPLPGS